MFIKALSILPITFAVLNFFFSIKLIQTSELNFPKLLYLTPKSSQSSYTLNEQDSLTNKIKKGWIFKSDIDIEIIIYFLVNEKITNFQEIEYSYVYFTTDENECQNITSKNSPDIFELNFIQDRSKLRTIDTEKLLKFRKARKLEINNGIETTLLVAQTSINLKYNSKKFYTCLSFSKKQNSNGQQIIKFTHQGSDNIYSQIITTQELLPIYLVIIFYFILLCFSALFSGLNLGLMSLDLTELNLLKKSGSDKEKIYAQKIYPLRKRGNLLLCTILIGNVLVNSTSTLILGNYLEGVFAAIGSTLLIVLFGEIIPQAICSRHGLAVGAYTRYITYFFLYLTSFVSFPLGKILDFFLGKEIAATYNREIVRELTKQTKEIQEQQYKFISGALDFKHKVVKDIMVPLNDVFSLDINSILDFETFKIILHQGYSRIPVYEGSKENMIGLILIQDLLLNDPADKVPLKAVIDYYKHQVPKCKLQDSLASMFEKFRKGDCHMAFVYENDANLNCSEDAILEAVGIVTFENIIEELVQSDIKDEADTRRERRKKKNKDILRGKYGNGSISNENLNIFVTEEDQTNRPLISPQIRKALFYFLASSVKPFTGEFINPKKLEALLRNPDYMIEKRNLSENDEYLYKHGIECDYFIIILDGNALLQVGSEKYEINAGLFSYYGVNALISEGEKDPLECIGNDSFSEPYKPEFSLKVTNYCVCFKITRKEWKDAVKQSLMERLYTPKQNKLRDNDINNNEKNTEINQNINSMAKSNLTVNV